MITILSRTLYSMMVQIKAIFIHVVWTKMVNFVIYVMKISVTKMINDYLGIY